ncbi:hypothetical protein DRW41_03760 [Neobacillus piezotolerans]|uniref:Uncharacterized protein n=1 Tax=Neobacillus piezotolerans TaxID=2259171 RepID=A0A3D8GW45_9BACI|nr:hypothetical protein [Neobacillus piezotolerans]RDU38687.1 hypothetical protein DRW41_03760 [Neobacillus piezotolerans]
MNFLLNIFKRVVRSVPQARSGDVEFEIQEQLRNIQKENKFIKVINLKHKKVILYRILFDVPEKEEKSIMLR